MPRKERRKERRIKARLPIRISYPDNQPLDAQTENISRLGTYVELEKAIPLGVKVNIIIEITNYTNDSSLIGDMKCRGDIFRCTRVREMASGQVYGVGIFFTDFFTEEDRNKLSKYIDFLILKEQEDIKQAMQKWRERRKKKRRRLD